ncbi:hypothetical protein BD410DRAFT_787566 [Rickenella mellea]|uniref:Uncharacterized protein n=1 Tax=Rickenella mellea TaxID=50990 RepID=A0A4Y7Q6F6_9AGAM|nr:hypothetical protein BD410DRAFT_787566 [Rickenella mellea]
MASTRGLRNLLSFTRTRASQQRLQNYYGCRSSKFSLARRNMSSAHGGEPKLGSDMPWIIGSGAVTVAGLAYLLSPPSKSAAHSVAHHHQESEHDTHAVKEHAEPMKDDEGTEASGEEVKESVQQAVKADSPSDAQASEEGKDETPGDASDTSDSNTSKSVSPNDDKEVKLDNRPKKKGTVQDEGDSGPTNMGDARKKRVEGKAPVEASKDKDKKA